MAQAAISAPQQKDTKEMTDRAYDRHYREARRESGRFGRYLASRPAESWIFFAVGVFLGGFFFVRFLFHVFLSVQSRPHEIVKFLARAVEACVGGDHLGHREPGAESDTPAPPPIP